MDPTRRVPSSATLQPYASGGQHSESNAAYFSWLTSSRLSDAAEERTNYFVNLQKGVLPESIGRLPKGHQATTLLELMTNRASHSKILRCYSLGTAIGFRIRQGVLTDIPAILVFVSRKVHKQWLTPIQCLPTILEGPGSVWCDVDVIEFSYFGAPELASKEQLYTEIVDDLRSLYENVWLDSGELFLICQETYGTLGAIVRSQTANRQVGFLTNRHVAVNLDYPNQKMFHPTQEVKEAIFSMGNDKSPGPDGYTAAFFKEAWDIVSSDVTKAVQEFFINGKLLKELNHTIIALIPKVASPSRINDYRPISCCNVLFKCISKIIANRIKESLKVLVSLNQSAFVLERKISDNILLMQELMHNYHLDRGMPRCAFKVDIQKAYYTVDWGFLKEVLMAFGFHHRMVAWIMECVTTTFSISINGVLHGYFKGKRGLQQGDPLSPYLFTLIMEVLTLMLSRRVRDSELFTYHRYCSELEIVNLCFADDLFLFAHGDANSARVIMEVLDEFKLASGLTPSLPKSTAYFCNVLNHTKLAILQTASGQKRIQDWKNKSLSAAGRLQLVQSVLGSMHVYWASVFILPSCFLLDIEQLMRVFLWCQGKMMKGKSKVAWKVVCLPKSEGGLGVRRLELFNKALIISHIWNLLSLKQFLWVKWIHTYKLKGRSFWDIPCRGNMTWGWRKLLHFRPIIRDFIWHRVESGSTVFAWFDKWCLNSPLSDVISMRDIHRAGFNAVTKVRDIALDGSWHFPSEWHSKYPNLNMPTVPLFTDWICFEWLELKRWCHPFGLYCLDCIRQDKKILSM
ncbi:hypothetical protein Tco_0637385 [Tanacetum coccineum]